MKIHDITGRLVATLVNEKKSPGSYVVQWNGRDDSGRRVASGVYLYRLKAGEFVQTRKMVLMR